MKESRRRSSDHKDDRQGGRKDRFGEFLTTVILHAILIVALALIGSVSVYLWQMLFAGVVPNTFIDRVWMILFLGVVFFVPQWLAFSTVSYVTISYLTQGVWWRHGGYGRFLRMHAWFIGVALMIWIGWSTIAEYATNIGILVWAVIGLLIAVYLYVRLHRDRMHHVSNVVHSECACIRRAAPWILLHWVGGSLALVMLSSILPWEGSVLQMLLVSGVFGAVLSLDMDRFRRVSAEHSQIATKQA